MKLEISIEASLLFQSSTIRRLRLTLFRSFKNLSQLNLHLLACDILDENNLQSLLDSLTKGMMNLTQVNLHFLSCANTDDQCIRNFKPFIFKGCKQLKRLEVILSGYCREFVFEKNHYFDPNMDKWLSQKTYHDEMIWSDATSIIPKGAGLLCSNVGRYCKRLESLAFEIPVFRESSLMKIEHFVMMITKMSHLKRLNLSFASQANDEYIDKVSFIIGQKLKKLESLTLWFHSENNEVTDEGLKKLASNIFPALSQLTYFAFCLRNCHRITDDGVTHFGMDIANHLKNLAVLILSFDSADSLTSAVPSKLTQPFKNSLLSLRKLVLDFEWLGELEKDINRKEKGKYSLVLPEKVENLDLYLYYPECLISKSWEGLQQLSIIIGYSSDDTQFFDMFSKESPNLKNLTQLKLIFISSHKVTDEKIGELTLAIGRNLHNLKTLELGFSGCSLITTKCFIIIGQNLCQNLKQLVGFHLRFYDLEASHSEDLVFLVKLIAMRLQKLESLTLFFFCVLKKSHIKSTLDLICPLITEHLKKLKELAFKLLSYKGSDEDSEDDDGESEEWEEFQLNAEEEAEVRQQMRKQLCHIPKLYIS